MLNVIFLAETDGEIEIKVCKDKDEVIALILDENLSYEEYAVIEGVCLKSFASKNYNWVKNVGKEK